MWHTFRDRFGDELVLCDRLAAGDARGGAGADGALVGSWEDAERFVAALDPALLREQAAALVSSSAWLRAVCQPCAGLDDTRLACLLTEAIFLGHVRPHRRPAASPSGGGGAARAATPDARAASASATTWIELQLVWDASGEAVAGVPLTLEAAAGEVTTRTTGADGLVRLDSIRRGSYAVRSATGRLKYEECAIFAGLGDEPSGGPSARDRDGDGAPAAVRAIRQIDTVRVSEGEALAQIARRHGLAADELAYFNWGSDDTSRLGDPTTPRFVHVPRPWVLRGLGTAERHVVRLRPPLEERLELRVLDAATDEPVARARHVLETPDGRRLEDETDGAGSVVVKRTLVGRGRVVFVGLGPEIELYLQPDEAALGSAQPKQGA